MTSLVKERARKPQKKERSMPIAAALKSGRTRQGRRERVLVEFSQSLLKRTDEAASRLEKNRSELIRTAVEMLLDSEEKRRFEAELASAYAANADLNRAIAKEFEAVDREGF